MRPFQSLPDRALTDAELQALRESDAITEAAPMALVAQEPGIRLLALQYEETLYGLGYDPEEGWTVVTERGADDPKDLEAVRDILRGWADGVYRDATHVD
ncbi:hypothetical protein AUR64_12300 [Haloprofundus marisrubri]|uniref:DUF7964 domain-containing protein n=1 Tax=Haloprofundus marisrubri TaxID=1514971 RepID=A0A0W1R9Y9_9EURY|nr:hypothetical protein [Haloprofundus marisrubri]KTG10345.1 hypothetical protein AUR64_12300 [Haloprofundus marisrubri]